jgi:molecular chaperone HtpG
MSDMKETLGFQAEVESTAAPDGAFALQPREIFLRELISNASDACDKLRFEALGRCRACCGSEPELEIRVWLRQGGAHHHHRATTASA